MAQKRDRFIAQVEQLAKNKGMKTRIERWRGKGGHAMIWVGDKVTTFHREKSIQRPRRRS
jgi:hypothetical protein